ncbi:hypothetical protein KR222_007521 [Zaprionus bogoriensis]|nr:hypothetical protein KR222_007521 [Zaprionus bogoriensis]
MNSNPENVVAAHNSSHSRQFQPQLNSVIPLPGSVAVEVEIANGSGDGGGGGSSPKIMEWTNDDALELIEQYRCHTELWNRADPKYKDKLCRFRAWSEIADRFGCSKAEVERKMNVLLTQYRREKHKMFVKIYQGIQPNPSKWYAFKRFDFMEAGGGSLSGLPSSAIVGGVSTSSSSSTHNGLNGLASVAAATAAYESSTISAAANGGATGSIGCGGGGGGGGTLTMPGSQHRRIKTKELKYFGAMGLNIPMLIASSQTLDNWNTTGQYSPPIGNPGGGAVVGGGGVEAVGLPNVQQQQQQLRVPMPMSYGSSSGAPYVGGGGGGGGSSSSEFQPSPHKIDTSDNEENPNRIEATAAALGQLAAKVERRSPLYSSAGGGAGGGAGAGGGDAGAGMLGRTLDDADAVNAPAASSATLSESGSSPIPNTNTNTNANSNTNMHEAHKNHLLQSSPVAAARAATPRQAHEQLHHLSHQALQQHHHGHLVHRQDEGLDIKQELVDYFHPPAGALPGTISGPGGAGVSVGEVPAPPESHRSYGSAGEESRLQLDMAQDLRVAQAKANFGSFVLPPRSSSAHLAAAAAAAAMPLNMRKLTAASSAGHLLMNTLLSSRESMSDPEGENDETATDLALSPGRIKSSVSAQDASSAAAAAAALYAESLSRDDCDFVGSNVTMKLRAMDRTQRIIAEKLIGEVLYYGQLNELERTTRIQPK